MEDKEQVKEKIEEKEQSKPFWQNIPPIVIIVGAGLLYLAFNSMQLDKTSGSKYFVLVLIVIAVLFLLSKQDTKQIGPVNPREAELLMEQECERKTRWKQYPFGPMSTFEVGPISDMMHRDARGQYYNIAVKVIDPFYKTFHYVGKVMASGPERGFATIIGSFGPMHGREIQQEKDLTNVPDYVKRSRKYPLLEKLWGLK